MIRLLIILVAINLCSNQTVGNCPEHNTDYPHKYYSRLTNPNYPEWAHGMNYTIDLQQDTCTCQFLGDSVLCEWTDCYHTSEGDSVYQRVPQYSHDYNPEISTPYVYKTKVKPQYSHLFRNKQFRTRMCGAYCFDLSCYPAKNKTASI